MVFKRGFKKGKSSKNKKQDKRISKLESKVGGIEYKQFSATATSAFTANTPVNSLLGVPEQGATALGRIGDQIKVHRLMLKVRLTANAELADALYGTIARVACYSQKGGNGTAPVAGQVFFGDTTNGDLAPPNVASTGGLVGRYLGKTFNRNNPVTVYRDVNKIVSFLPSANITAETYTFSASGSHSPIEQVNMVIDFPKGHLISFSGPGQSITEVLSGGLFVYLVALSANVSYTWESSIIFTDM